MEDPHYEDQLPPLLRHYLESGDMGPLASALGCVTLRYETDYKGLWDNWSLYSPDQPPAQCEDLVCRSLMEVLLLWTPSVIDIHSNKNVNNFAKTEKITSLIDGLHRNRRWVKCLDTLDGAYRLAALLVSFPAVHYSARNFAAGAAMTNVISPGACCIANEWLRPEQPYADGDLIGASVCDRMARTIFGDAWCDLVLAGVELGRISSGRVYDFLVASRPPFREGLLPDRLVQPALPLPEMTAP